MEGDNDSMKDLGIVSGDLVHVIFTGGQADNATSDPKSVSEPVSKSSTDMACSSGFECVENSGVTRMETDAVVKHCTEAVMNGNNEGGRPGPGVANAELGLNRAHPENGDDDIADDSRERVTEAGSTGVPHAMSAEELQVVNRYLNEPMVIQETTDKALPQSLVLAYSLVQPKTADAVLLTAIDVLMSELGYQRTPVSSTKFHLIISK